MKHEYNPLKFYCVDPAECIAAVVLYNLYYSTPSKASQSLSIPMSSTLLRNVQGITYVVSHFFGEPTQILAA